MPAAQDNQDLDASYCDPVLTANIYCAGLLDQLIHSALRAFWQDVSSQLPAVPVYMWLMRYRRSGYHLKVRLHGPTSARSMLMEMLQKRVTEFFSEVKETPVGEEITYHIAAGDLPVDEEDEATTNYPDRSLVWTHYRRSFVSLGAPPFMDDDRYVGYFTRCLGRGCELVLSKLNPNKTGEFTNTSRQLVLLSALIEGMTALDFSPEKFIDYLTYHRDWLIRFALFKSKSDPDKATEILNHFGQQYQKMQALVERALRPAVAHHLAAANGSPTHDGQTPWQASLCTLKEYVVPFCGDETHHLDHYASDPLYPIPFKVFHGLANQLGLRFLEESFAHHLLLSCLAEDSKLHLSGDLRAEVESYEQAV